MCAAIGVEFKASGSIAASEASRFKCALGPSNTRLGGCVVIRGLAQGLVVALQGLEVVNVEAPVAYSSKERPTRMGVALADAI